MNMKPSEQPKHDLPAGLSRPARQALEAAGITRLEQLDGMSEAQVGRLHGMGPKGLRILREALAEKGRAFAAEPPRKR